MDSDSLDWRDKHKKLKEKIKYIFTAAFLTDMTIRIIDKDDTSVEFRAHKLFLSMASAAFEAMLKSDFNEVANKTIEIRDTKPEIFKLLLQYIYGHTITFLNIQQAWDLFVIADKYLISDLKDFCSEYIEKNLDPGSACMCLEMAETYELSNIKDTSLKMVRHKTKEVVTDSNFVHADLMTVVLILEQEKLSMREFKLFKAIETWIQNAIEKKGEDIKEYICSMLIPKFRFFDMTVKEFTDGPIKSNLMSKDDIISIVVNMCSNDCLPVPSGFIKDKRTFLGEVPCDSMSKTVHKICKDNCGRRLFITVNQDIILTAVKIFTKEGPVSEEYEEEVDVSFRMEGSNFWESETIFREKTNCSNTLVIQLSKPFEMMKGIKYDMYMRTKFGPYKVVNLDGFELYNDDLCFSFCKDPQFYDRCSFPLSSICFTISV